MSRAARAGSYRAVLMLPSALRTFVPALGGRLAYGLFPLATLFTVHQATGSYATAGLAVAAFGLASLTLPAKARLTDRYGQRPVLPPLALVTALALVAATLTTDPVALVTLIGLAGLTAPPLGSAMRATWRRLTAGSALKERAYAVDSVAEETLYLIGPLIAGLLIGLGPARWALLATAALLLLGTLGMATAPPSRLREPDTSSSLSEGAGASSSFPSARPSMSGAAGPFLGVLGVVLVAGAGVSVAYTGMAATAQAHGRPGAAGLLEAALGLGSVTGGLLWARREHTRHRSRHFAALLTVLAVALLVAAAAPGLIALGVVLAVAGLAIAPLYVVAYLASDDLAPPHRRTEASTWVNVAANGGNAAGTALAGFAADLLGPSRGFLAGGLLVAAAAAVTFARNLHTSPIGSPDSSAEMREVTGSRREQP